MEWKEGRHALLYFLGSKYRLPSWTKYLLQAFYISPQPMAVYVDTLQSLVPTKHTICLGYFVIVQLNLALNKPDQLCRSWDEDRDHDAIDPAPSDAPPHLSVYFTATPNLNERTPPAPSDRGLFLLSDGVEKRIHFQSECQVRLVSSSAKKLS